MNPRAKSDSLKVLVLAASLITLETLSARPLSFDEFLRKSRHLPQVNSALPRRNAAFRLSVPLGFEVPALDRTLHRDATMEAKYRQALFALEAYWKDLIHRLNRVALRTK